MGVRKIGFENEMHNVDEKYTFLEL
jgi:hypothetical protein